MRPFVPGHPGGDPLRAARGILINAVVGALFWLTLGFALYLAFVRG